MNADIYLYWLLVAGLGAAAMAATIVMCAAALVGTEFFFHVFLFPRLKTKAGRYAVMNWIGRVLLVVAVVGFVLGMLGCRSAALRDEEAVKWFRAGEMRAKNACIEMILNHTQPEDWRKPEEQK